MKDIWLDCDPGHDDMMAIIMSALHQECNLLGISTSAGNSTIKNTTTNALNILQEIDKTNIQVYQGSQFPLCCELNVAPDIHGQSGLEGATLKTSSKQPIKQDALYHVYNKIKNHPNKVQFVVTGAMTNLALLMKTFPNIKQYINTITIMGGATGIGNWSPSAQFNILVDPQAASIVFHSGIKVTMIPLEVTHTVEITNEIFEQLKQMPSQFSNKLYDLFKYFQKQYKINQNFDFPVAHDPCTIYYLLHPEAFKGRDSYVTIQLQGKSRGRTNCYFMHYPKPINAFVCEKVDVNGFWKVMMRCIRMIK